MSFWIIAAEFFTTEQVCKILSTVRDRIKMEDWTAVCWINKNVKSYQLCGTELRWRTEQLSVGVTRKTRQWHTSRKLQTVKATEDSFRLPIPLQISTEYCRHVCSCLFIESSTQWAKMVRPWPWLSFQAKAIVSKTNLVCLYNSIIFVICSSTWTLHS